MDPVSSADGGSGAPDPAGPVIAGGSFGLRLVGEAGRPLTKAQKKFDRLLRKVEALRADKARATARCDRFLKLYQESIHPEEQRLAKRRREVVFLLAALRRAPKGLGARQREQLTDLLITQLRELMAVGPEMFEDAELKKLWEELHPRDDDQGRKPDADAKDASGGPAGDHDGGEAAMPPEMADMIRALGLDPTLFKPGMSFEDFLKETQRQLGEEHGAEGEAEGFAGASGRGGRPGAGSSRPKSERAQAAERKAAERAALREEARKRTVVSIYKQLAKVLHPDLEQDPAMRERKHTLMQDLTKAYREGDLHTLLRLELEWISREEGDLARLGDEKLGIYAELLEEQVAELEAEIRDVPYSPRFAVVARFMNPFWGAPTDITGILTGIRQLSESLKQFRDAMSGPRAREELREVLRQAAASQRRRRDTWDDPLEGGF